MGKPTFWHKAKIILLAHDTNWYHISVTLVTEFFLWRVKLVEFVGKHHSHCSLWIDLWNIHNWKVPDWADSYILFCPFHWIGWWLNTKHQLKFYCYFSFLKRNSNKASADIWYLVKIQWKGHSMRRFIWLFLIKSFNQQQQFRKNNFLWLCWSFTNNLTNFDPSEKKLHKLTDTNFMWTITA